MVYKPISVAAQSKAWVCGRPVAGIAGPNPAGCMDFFFLRVLLVLSSRYFCDEPITRPEESYRMLCLIIECDPETSAVKRPRTTRAVKP